MSKTHLQSSWYDQQLLEEEGEDVPIPPLPPLTSAHPTVPTQQKHPKYPTKHKTERCYTCNPKGMVLRHIISDTRCTTFHFDMWKRPFLIVTPKHHYREIHEMEPSILSEFFCDIHVFCISWGFPTYQIMMNAGGEKTHDHFHVKLRLDPQRLQQMRDDHFKRQTYERALRPTLS